jgi:hypothetical protein
MIARSMPAPEATDELYEDVELTAAEQTRLQAASARRAAGVRGRPLAQVDAEIQAWIAGLVTPRT